MLEFHPLTVTDLRRTIRDAVVVTLRPDDPEVFRFTQGQYLTFHKEIGGEELRRSYSICTSPDEGMLQIAVKRVYGGLFSGFANGDLQVGDRLEALPPMGRFSAALDPDGARNHLAFAAGSGITPVLSILKTVLKREPRSRFALVYANRAVNTIMFREELEDLKNRNMGRLNVLHILGSGQDIDLFSGRLDRAKCDALFSQWIDVEAVDMAHICGPEPMMKTLVQSLEDHGLSPDKIRYELFGTGQRGRRARQAHMANADAAGATEATVTVEGASHVFSMLRSQSILEASLKHDLGVPFACRAGVCSTCKARVLAGDYEMLANHALDDYEVARGTVLTCQCYPTSDRITVVFDTH
jgi:ring-1,2-phenylacetyl-CoA epoxidase subunit PaaE